MPPLSLTNNNISLSGKKSLNSSFSGLSIQCPDGFTSSLHWKWLQDMKSKCKTSARYKRQVNLVFAQSLLEQCCAWSGCLATTVVHMLLGCIWVSLFYPVDFASCVHVFMVHENVSKAVSRLKLSSCNNSLSCSRSTPLPPVLHTPAQVLVSKEQMSDDLRCVWFRIRLQGQCWEPLL